MRCIFFVVIGVSIFAGHLSVGQGQLKIDAQFRLRSESRNGYITLPEEKDTPVFITSQRTRLNLFYSHDERFNGYISAQDVRIWGQVNQLDESADLNIYQAWSSFRPTQGLHFKVGRQELEYDNLKLMANANWRQQGWSHDAMFARRKSKDSTLTADVATAISEDNQAISRDRFEARNYKNLYLFWLNKKLKEAEVSFIFVNRGLQKPGTAVCHMQTLGAFGCKDLGNITPVCSYYHQLGKNTLDQDVNTYMVSFETSYSYRKKIEVRAGFDILSGTRSGDLGDPGAGETNTYIPLYARRHRYFGKQDMFYFGGFDVPPGLKDIYLKIYDKVHKKWTLGMEAHSFSTHRSLMGNNWEGMDKNLGVELDTLFQYKYSDFFNISSGYMQYFATGIMVALKQRGSKNELANFFYLAFDFRPELLNWNLWYSGQIQPSQG